MEELYVKLAEILDVASVSADDRLEDFEMWDSLSKLATVAMLDASFGITMSGKELSELTTVKDMESSILRKKNS